MAEKNKGEATAQKEDLDIERIKKRLDMFDQRLDNIDSMVTAVAERVMRRPLTIIVTCPHCGRNVEVAVIGTEKPTK